MRSQKNWENSVIGRCWESCQFVEWYKQYIKTTYFSKATSKVLHTTTWLQTKIKKKNNLHNKEILLHLDCSENYVNKEQQVIQSAYDGNDTPFTACCYLRKIDNVANKNFTITSKSPNNSHCVKYRNFT